MALLEGTGAEELPIALGSEPEELPILIESEPEELPIEPIPIMLPSPPVATGGGGSTGPLDVNSVGMLA